MQLATHNALKWGVAGLASAAVLVVLAACGGGGSAEPEQPAAPQPPPTSPNVINGITVPPDPGPAGSLSVAGVDSDINGIRDDIDRFLATRYGLNPTALRAGRLSARAHQKVATASPNDRAAARVALQESARAGICAGDDFEAAGLTPSHELNYVFLRTYNTPERLKAKAAVGAVAGVFVQNVSSITCD